MAKRAQRPTRPDPTLTKHLELDHRTGVLDVAVIDVLSQAEFLLNRAREIQRQILLVRGVGGHRGMSRRRLAARTVKRIANEMLRESGQLTQILEHLGHSASLLRQAVT